MNPDEKECPYCFEVIKARATKCKHCGEFLPTAIERLPALSPSLPSPPDLVPALPVQQPPLPVSIESGEIITLLASLVDKCLVAYEHAIGRYRLLETVRQYGRDRLFERKESPEFRARHAQHFLSLAEAASPQLTGPEQAVWLERLESEHDNLRTAIEFLRQEAEGEERGLRLGGALQHFWMVRGHLSEGREQLVALLSNPGAQGRNKARAYALNGAGILAWNQGDYVAARSLFEESLEIRRELGDRRGIAGSLNNLGMLAQDQGDYSLARSLLEEALTLNRELGNRAWEATNLNNLGNLARDQGDYVAARVLHKESLEIRRELGDGRGIASSLNNLGNAVSDQGDYATARSLLEESLGIKRELGDRQGIANSLHNLGHLASGQGDDALARVLHEESLAIRRELGDRRGIANSLHNLGHLALNQVDYVAARALYEESLEIERELGDKQSIAVSLEMFASLALKEERPERAVRLWGAASALREEIGAPLPPNAGKTQDRDQATAREALGEEAFMAAWEEGRSITMEQAIEFALQDGKTRLLDLRPSELLPDSY